MFEFIQGEGGVNVLEQSFVDEIFALAKQHDLATISDEVQTGMGRTAKLLAAEYFNVKPDNPVIAGIRERMTDTADAFREPLLSIPSESPSVKIDYIFVSPDIKVLSADIPDLRVSDHRPHVAEIEI